MVFKTYQTLSYLLLEINTKPLIKERLQDKVIQIKQISKYPNIGNYSIILDNKWLVFDRLKKFIFEPRFNLITFIT